MEAHADKDAAERVANDDGDREEAPELGQRPDALLERVANDDGDREEALELGQRPDTLLVVSGGRGVSGEHVHVFAMTVFTESDQDFTLKSLLRIRINMEGD